MTVLEALVINSRGWDSNDPISKLIYEKAQKLINEEKNRIYLEAQKDQLERELNEVNQKINQAKIPF